MKRQQNPPFILSEKLFPRKVNAVELQIAIDANNQARQARGLLSRGRTKSHADGHSIRSIKAFRFENSISFRFGL